MLWGLSVPALSVGENNVYVLLGVTAFLFKCKSFTVKNKLTK